VQEPFDALRSKVSTEAALSQLESHARKVQAVSKVLARDAVKLLGEAHEGTMLSVAKSMQNVELRLAELNDAVTAAKKTDMEAVSRSIGGKEYLNEVIAAAHELGLNDVRISRNAVLSYPHRVSFDSPNGYKLGRKTMTAMRPTAVANALKAERAKVVPLPQTYLEAMERGYLIASKDAVGISVSLTDVYEILTILPGASKSYSEADFVRDIGILHEMGPHVTKAGRRVSFPSSTSARMSRGHSAVTSRGDEVVYASIRFDRSESKA
jgi:hypothetical protein